MSGQTEGRTPEGTRPTGTTDYLEGSTNDNLG
jgi:hypothetical protein